MRLCELLNVKKGVTSLIGGGGKTTLMHTLAKELAANGSVIIAATTRIRRPENTPVLCAADANKIAAALKKSRVICVGEPAENGKLSAPAIPVSELCNLTDYVLIEADGSKGLPLKAHAPHEPVIAPETGCTVLLVGASGLGALIATAAHRPELYARLAGCGVNEPATPQAAANVIAAEALHDAVFINQIENERDTENVRALAALLAGRVYGGALQKGVWECLC